MSLSGLIPPDIGTNAALAICVIAFISATARGFSGFGSALIFMPLASSMAAPRLVAALLARGLDAGHAIHGIDAQDVRPAEMGVVVRPRGGTGARARGIASVLGADAGGEQREDERGD